MSDNASIWNISVFCCLLLMFFVFVKHYFVFLKHLFFCVCTFLGKIEDFDKGSFPWTEFAVSLPWTHEYYSLSSLIICFFKRLIICVCFWTTWVIWIWAANPYLIIYLPALILKVQPSGGVPVLWEITYWIPSFGEVWAFSSIPYAYDPMNT